MPGNVGQLEPLSYARLFAVVMIHAQILAEIAKCNKTEMSDFYTHVCLEFFEQTAKLLQKIKNSKVDEKDRATLKENLSTIYALTELNFRLRSLYCREAAGDPSNLPWAYKKRKLVYDVQKLAAIERKVKNWNQLDRVQRSGHEEPLSQPAELERSSIVHDQRWAHLKSYAAHWLEKLGEDPNNLCLAEITEWDMETMGLKFFSIIECL